ncbi:MULTISPECIES: hypothetical protein [unclassified Streptomyces]|uniref:hypothetical protein n=1 Tax=unclassified Streptomyces TaxID=2593676 RepID=UPI00081AF3FA|nr:hypothetical protein [Streptomyces sp. BvitLS-983]SCD92962.1 hypothetical protein GA0115250_129213 [Streptomyces sp. BvitLS-983]
MSVLAVVGVLVVVLVMVQVAQVMHRYPEWAVPIAGAIAAAGLLVAVLTATQ